MKFILPLLISVFITGCTLTNINQSEKSSQEESASALAFKKEKAAIALAKKKEKAAIAIAKKKEYNEFLTRYNLKKEHVYSNLNDTIISIAEQLFDSKSNKKNPSRVILTSFVDLNDLENTSTFGRLVSESMFNELHIRKFLVTDFRGKENVSVNKDGEFHITRDVEKLKDIVDAVEYILVGTYVKFENKSLLINARILDSISGNVFSSARVVYQPKDCSLFDICEKKNIVKSKISRTLKPQRTPRKIKPENKTPIMIIEDN
ncbi:FlgO family outer membrane protein [Arcobacteraceae bacterium]|nr:FlgO family outer membrane protein [Arcobacteraceae bacterium]